MKTSKLLAGGAALLLVCALPGRAAAQAHYTSTPQGSEVKLQGTSSLHDWEMKGNIIGGFIELGPEVKFDPLASAVPGLKGDKVPMRVHAFIPVRSLHSEADHMPDVMERLMQEALKEDQFKRFDFTLTEMTFKGQHASGKPFDLEATGNLAMAGVTNKVTFPVTIEPVEPNKLKVTGTVPVKMTAYGVTPPAPSFGLGMMRCGDDVKVLFDWQLIERK